MQADELKGVWRAISWHQRYDDGRMVYPLGTEIDGVLHYDEHRMACLISRRGRPPFDSGGQWDADESERAAAYSGFLGYSGRYEIEDDRVHHHVDISLYPAWVGTDQVRLVRLTDGELHLQARLEENTVNARTADLIWRREK